ncbi:MULTISPECIES: XkdF-like putative serine protease domain-containing protein [unclassified Exiguobacterium]|uniref:XkdF-like putative serine protease domain-containing protein n=1 Tax=unclassified Exiguobacterium TaxID=2644629 RepID=UPI0025BA1888|nr:MULTISPECIES: XkdF-like putative serine protease domain-containing protein [unclassified Exiguobacterium]
MPREITNLIPSHVSIVDKAANKRSFLLTKSEAAPNVSKQVEYIVKEDEAQQIVYGIVYEPDVEDAHGDFMTAAEIEKAAHIFMKEYQQIDKQHDFTSEVGKVIESYIAPADFEIGGQHVTKGSWVMAVKVEDEMWTSIQKGEFTGFSLAGMAELIERSAPTEDSEKGLLHLMKSLIRRVSKGEIKDDIEGARPLNDVNTAAWRFSDVVDSERWSWKPDISRIKAAYDDLGEYVNALGDGVTKSQGEEVTDMTQEQIEKLLAENNANLLKSVEALLKGEGESQKQGDGSGAEDKGEEQGGEVEQTELEKAQAAEIEELKKQLSVRPLPASHEAVEKAEVPDKASYASHFG